ncbi:hypothetical protein LTS17_012017 [Exophiala oligosperma]
MADSANVATEERVCASCGKAESQLPTGSTLKRCGWCLQENFCSKASNSPRPTLPAPQFLTFFNQLKSEPRTYQVLIDTFRLRCEEDYTIGGHKHGIYGGDPPLPVFRDFLARAKTAGMLPPWWNSKKRKACEEMAQHDEHFNIKFKVEESDILEFYSNCLMPLRLRFAALNVYGGSYGSGQNQMPADYVCQCRGK